jgi:hypothetical protein
MASALGRVGLLPVVALLPGIDNTNSGELKLPRSPPASPMSTSLVSLLELRLAAKVS